MDTQNHKTIKVQALKGYIVLFCEQCTHSTTTLLYTRRPSGQMIKLCPECYRVEMIEPAIEAAQATTLRRVRAAV